MPELSAAGDGGDRRPPCLRLRDRVERLLGVAGVRQRDHLGGWAHERRHAVPLVHHDRDLQGVGDQPAQQVPGDPRPTHADDADLFRQGQVEVQAQPPCLLPLPGGGLDVCERVAAVDPAVVVRLVEIDPAVRRMRVPRSTASRGHVHYEREDFLGRVASSTSMTGMFSRTGYCSSHWVQMISLRRSLYTISPWQDGQMSRSINDWSTAMVVRLL
jgi:hypothetical protein